MRRQNVHYRQRQWQGKRPPIGHGVIMEAPVDPLLGSIGGAEITGLDEIQQDQCDDQKQPPWQQENENAPTLPSATHATTDVVTSGLLSTNCHRHNSTNHSVHTTASSTIKTTSNNQISTKRTTSSTRPMSSSSHSHSNTSARSMNISATVNSLTSSPRPSARASKVDTLTFNDKENKAPAASMKKRKKSNSKSVGPFSILRPSANASKVATLTSNNKENPSMKKRKESNSDGGISSKGSKSASTTSKPRVIMNDSNSSIQMKSGDSWVPKKNYVDLSCLSDTDSEDTAKKPSATAKRIASKRKTGAVLAVAATVAATIASTAKKSTAVLGDSDSNSYDSMLRMVVKFSKDTTKKKHKRTTPPVTDDTTVTAVSATSHRVSFEGKEDFGTAFSKSSAATKPKKGTSLLSNNKENVAPCTQARSNCSSMKKRKKSNSKSNSKSTGLFQYMDEDSDSDSIWKVGMSKYSGNAAAGKFVPVDTDFQPKQEVIELSDSEYKVCRGSIKFGCAATIRYTPGPFDCSEDYCDNCKLHGNDLPYKNRP